MQRCVTGHIGQDYFHSSLKLHPELATTGTQTANLPGQLAAPPQ